LRNITLITTGGTIEKTYDEATGRLENSRSVVEHMLSQLRLADIRVSTLGLMAKDSLDLTDADRKRIVDMILAAGGSSDSPGDADGIVVLHGTDTLGVTGEAIHKAIANPAAPIVLTGAMRPYEMTRSDALQNLTEAIFAVGVLEPGVYCVAHGHALRFPGVVKDQASGTFVRAEKLV